MDVPGANLRLSIRIHTTVGAAGSYIGVVEFVPEVVANYVLFVIIY